MQHANRKHGNYDGCHTSHDAEVEICICLLFFSFSLSISNAFSCSGGQSECPKSPPMVDGTTCQERGQCRNGKCIPYCETQGLQSCMCDIIQDACKRCCRMSINETCFPVEPPDILSDGTPCIQGFCNKACFMHIFFIVVILFIAKSKCLITQGVCEKSIQDVVERFWDIIEEININKVLKFMRDNIVSKLKLDKMIIIIVEHYM